MFVIAFWHHLICTAFCSDIIVVLTLNLKTEPPYLFTRKVFGVDFAMKADPLVVLGDCAKLFGLHQALEQNTSLCFFW